MAHPPPPRASQSLFMSPCICEKKKISRLERKSPVPPSSQPNPARLLMPPLEILWQRHSPATSVECLPLALCPCLRPKFSGSPQSTGWGGWARNWCPRSARKIKKKKRKEGEKRYNGGRNRDEVRAGDAAFSENLVASSQLKNKLERFPN